MSDVPHANCFEKKANGISFCTSSQFIRSRNGPPPPPPRCSAEDALPTRPRRPAVAQEALAPAPCFAKLLQQHKSLLCRDMILWSQSPLVVVASARTSGAKADYYQLPTQTTSSHKSSPGLFSKNGCSSSSSPSSADSLSSVASPRGVDIRGSAPRSARCAIASGGGLDRAPPPAPAPLPPMPPPPRRAAVSSSQSIPAREAVPAKPDRNRLLLGVHLGRGAEAALS